MVRKTLAFTIALTLALIAAWRVEPGVVMGAPQSQGGVIVVTSPADSGPGTLRDALNQARPGTTITFDPGAFPLDSPTTILIGDDPLPAIAQGDLTIDASDAGVIVDGSGLPGDGDGFLITSSGNVIKGLQILRCPSAGIRITEGGSNNLIGGRNATPGGPCTGDCNVISGHGTDGVNVAGSGTMSNVVSGNYIGLDASGTVAMGIGVDGVWIGDGAQDNRVGGGTPGERNVISGSANNGVVLDGVLSNTVSGNYIGTDASGTVAIGNGNTGIAIDFDAQNNVIGGTAAGEGNLISGNGGDGIRIANNSTKNIIAANVIGTDVTGAEAIGNVGAGILLEAGASSNVVGPNNVIAYNGGDGVGVNGPGALRNTITRNSIHHNGGQGIVLASGANAGLEPPVLSYLSSRRVQGTAPPNSVVEIFFDEGEQGNAFASSTTADDQGEFVFTPPQGTLEGPRVTCTATDPEGNTSRFSDAASLPEPTPFRAPPDVVGPTQVSLEPEVVGTNAGLALFCAVFFGFTSTVFNSVLEEYVEEIESAWGKLMPAAVRALRDHLRTTFDRLSQQTRSLVIAWVILMLVTALIESFLDPDVSLFSPARLSLVLTLFIAALMVGGVEVASDLLARRRLSPDMEVEARLNFVGFVIAIGCVLLSRGLKFRPGYLYGTVGALYLIPEFIGPARSGRRALMVLGTVLVGGLALWAASAFLPPALAGLEALFLTVFLIAVQGVLFQLVPLAVTEGGYIFRWDWRIWAGSLNLVLFLTFGTVLNPRSSAVEALRQNGVVILLILLGVYGVATLALYLVFPARLGGPGRARRAGSPDTESALRWTRERIEAALAARGGSTGLDLAGADLCDLDLSSMDLRGIILCHQGAETEVAADMQRADLSGANLEGAVVTAEQLSQAKSLRATTLPDGTILSEEDWRAEFEGWREVGVGK